MNRKRVAVYIIRSVGNRTREIEIQRDDENGRRTIRKYRSSPRRRNLINRAAMIWKDEDGD